MFSGKLLVGKSILAGLIVGIVPAIASAHPHFAVDVGVGENAPCPPPAVIVHPAPVARVWVEPVYQTVCDRVWREAITEDRCSRVWVPDLYQDQYVSRGRHQWIEHVLITPGHYEDRRESVIVAPGHWEDVQRQVLVSPGHWQEREVLEVRPERHHDEFSEFFTRFRF